MGRKDCRADIGKLVCKRPDQKYFRPHAPRMVSMATTQLCHCGGESALDGLYMNRCGFFSQNKHVFSKTGGWPDLI